ncbi:MAG TPA: tripartite tricarboxylate transporter substrate binding protein [Alphaproteobacteria bacterium]|nr:tripartite tricarboxylate transporter substrate binding protein [Alphaproteobacteria bacterium]
MRGHTRWAAAIVFILAAGVAIPVARADDAYPAKPVHVLVGFPAGSVADIVIRLLGQKASAELGQPFVVENRPGASSNIAAELVARAPKDGYTLLMATIANTINASLYHNLSFSFGSDLAPVMMVASVPTVLAVNPQLPAHNVAELIGLAKEKPGQLFFASSGNGTFTHLLGELFNMTADVKLAHVPYKGSPEVLADLIAGRVMVTFIPASAVLQHGKEGSVRLLATTGPRRTAAAPGLPTVAEAGLPGFEGSLWMGVLAPAGTPRAVVDRLAKALASALAAPDVKATLAGQGIDQVGLGPAEFAAYIRQDTDKWGKVVKAIGLKIE